MRTNKEKYLQALEDGIKDAPSIQIEASFKVMKDLFEVIFKYEIEVTPYDHDNPKADLAAGYDHKELEKHPVVMKFHKEVNELLEKAYNDGRPMPAVSRIIEMIEYLPIHPRLKIIAAYALAAKVSNAHAQFMKRDTLNKIAKVLEGAKTTEEITKRMSQLRNEANPKPPSKGDDGGIPSDSGRKEDDSISSDNPEQQVQ